MNEPTFKSSSSSRTIITELMIPSYTNFGGKIHGGVILSLMDKVAYVCATKHARTYCVTASIDGVDFLESVEVGELVSLKASINYTGRSSMVVGIRVESENVKNSVLKHTNTSYITMVAKDEHHQTVQVPGLILETDEEIRRFMEALRRKELRLAVKNDTRKIKDSFDLNAATQLLQNERCIIRRKESGS